MQAEARQRQELELRLQALESRLAAQVRENSIGRSGRGHEAAFARRSPQREEPATGLQPPRRNAGVPPWPEPCTPLTQAGGAGAASGVGGVIVGGGIDAGVTASSIAGRLSKLEAQLSQAVVKQEELEGVSRQMEGLQVRVCVGPGGGLECSSRERTATTAASGSPPPRSRPPKHLLAP